MTQTVLSVPDISCEHCARAITNALTPVAGVANVSVDIPGKSVTVEYDATHVDIAGLSSILAEEDYPVASVASR